MGLYICGTDRRTPSRKFIVAARVCKGEQTVVRVHGAIMELVAVLDRRNERMLLFYVITGFVYNKVSSRKVVLSSQQIRKVTLQDCMMKYIV